MDKQNLVKKLNKILLSNNVVENFHNEYSNNDDFRNALLSVLPEVEDCANQEQNNPWHKYNVLDHILHSVEEMNKRTTNMIYSNRLLLAYTMFLHDIGKPSCHIKREKNGRIMDSFFGHNLASAKIANRFLKEIEYGEKDRKTIEKLIEKHDIFMFISDGPTTNPYHRELSPQVIVDEYNDLSQVGNGKVMLRFLTLVGKCDSLAQNEKMTKGPLILLGKFGKMSNHVDEYLAEAETDNLSY